MPSELPSISPRHSAALQGEAAPLPSIDDIVAQGRTRERKTEIALGALVLLGGLAWKLAMRSLTGGLDVMSFGAIGLGAALLGHGLLGARR
ncbi:MAG TPA: hypothetical protein VLX92_14175 [Kofleriaceae bacterium]|nr:hypothetical protein [Kofleriaceae bacterium]